MSDVLELVEPIVLADRDEDPVLSVDVGRAERFADHGHDPEVLLAGRLGDQLLDPAAEARDLLGQHEGELVAAGPGRLAHQRAERGSGDLGRRDRAFGRRLHLLGAVQHLVQRAPISAAGTSPK